jgi:hypothetical protein
MLYEFIASRTRKAQIIRKKGLGASRLLEDETTPMACQPASQGWGKALRRMDRERKSHETWSSSPSISSLLACVCVR